MRAGSRDLVVVAVLGAAVLLGILIWHPLGRWPALIVFAVGVLIAAGVYRARPPAFPLGDEEDDPLPDATAKRPSASRRRPS